MNIIYDTLLGKFRVNTGGISSITPGAGITVDDSDPNNIILSSTSNIEVVSSYSFLPNPSTVNGLFYFCENSEGSKWLPGTWGGTYYADGLYYSNGSDWIFTKTPAQATQLIVDAGLNNETFVTPFTLKNAAQWATKSDIGHTHPNDHTHTNKTILDATEESFTTIQKNKLNGIEAGAQVNNISNLNATDLIDGTDSTLHFHSSDRNRANHTGTQLATTITEDTTHRFVSDAEKTTWNGKQNALGFTPEDTANKSTSTLDSASSVKFPVWSAILSYFSALQIRSILGVSVLSGSNTGDETTSSIQTKRPLKTINSTSIEGSGNITIIDSSKEPIINAGTISQYWRGDKSWQTLDKSSVGLSNVDNTSDINKPISNAAQTALNLKADKSITITINGITQDLSANRIWSITGGGSSLNTIQNLESFNFGQEEDSITKTIASALVTQSNLKSFLVIPQETIETSLDDFKLNGVSFSIENIIDNVSFDIRAIASNNASGIYTINYILNYQ